MEMEAVFGERLQQARKMMGISQRQAAEEFGITKVGYQNYEYARKMPSASKLPRIAKFYNVSLDYLFGLSDDPQLPDKETMAMLRQLQAFRNAGRQGEQS